MDENGNGSGDVERILRCGACDRPVGPDGLSTHMGGSWLKGGGRGKVCHSCRWGLRGLDKARTPEVQAKSLATRRRNAEIRNRRPSEVIQARVEDALERVLRPYFEGLEVEPDPKWSPRTTLQFYNEQSALSEKLLNRTEGLPVARTRTVDADDNDVLPPQFQNLPPDALERVIIGVLAGTGEVVDAEIVEEDDADQ